MKNFNRAQKRVLLTALAAFLWFGIFPPWRNGRWSAPWAEYPGTIFNPGFPRKTDIDFYRLLVVWMLVAVIAGVAILVLKREARP